MSNSRNFNAIRFAGNALLIVGLCLPVALAQDRDRDWDHDRHLTRIEPGTMITVRTSEAIDVEKKDSRVYPGFVEEEVRGENGRLAIPRGSPVELVVRVAHDNDLILDLASVTVGGDRFAVPAETNRLESREDNSIVGAIVGAIQGIHVHGRDVRVPRDSTLTFRIDRPMVVGMPDRGYDRDGRHYHYDEPWR